MNSPFIEALQDFNKQLDTPVEFWNQISEILGNRALKSDCCHAEATTYGREEFCSCCLKQCELEQ